MHRRSPAAPGGRAAGRSERVVHACHTTKPFHIKPLVSGRVVCAQCGIDSLELFRAIVLPHPLDPELVIAGMRCRICEAEQAISIGQEKGAVILSTSLPRS
jgi:hypothetical protein